ncbi:hypothetical protein Tco_0484886 [Tanacetum coccineum]
MNQNYEPNPIYNSSYFGFDQPPQYSINHQEDLNQQRISDVHNGWDKIDELQNELLQMIQSFCEKFLQQKQAASIDQSPLQEMSLQEIEDLKQHYLNEMLSLSNDLGIKDYRNEKIDIRFRRECENMINELKGKYNGMSIEINKKKDLYQLEQAAKLSTYTTEPSRHFNYFYDKDDEESSIPLREIISELPLSIAITPVLPTFEPEDSLIMGDEHLSTFPEKESDELIKSSVEDLVPIPSESEDTFGSNSDCDLPSCDDFSPINNYEEKSVTFSNPLFDLNDDFTSSDDKSLSDEDVPEDNVKIYSNSLFEFDDEYISSDVNPLLNEVLENIESKDSYVSNLDELLYMDISTDIENGYHDSEGDIIYLERPTSGIRANRGTLNKKNHKITNKHSPTILYKMSQPANDEFSQHLSDDEESNHENVSDTCATPKQQQQVIPQTTTISNIKLPILKKEENGSTSRREFQLEGWYCSNTFTVMLQKFKLLKRKKAKIILLMASQGHMRRFHGIG